MIIQIFMASGAVICIAAVAKFIWQEKGCFKVVYDDIVEISITASKLIKQGNFS